MFKGKVQAEFRDEKSFKILQKEFAKCTGYFKAQAGTEASLKNLTKSGTNKWTMDFEAGVQCDGVLKFINAAIKKSIGGGGGLDVAEEDLPEYQATGDYVQDTLATIEAVTSEFSTRLLACGRR